MSIGQENYKIRSELGGDSLNREFSDLLFKAVGRNRLNFVCTVYVLGNNNNMKLVTNKKKLDVSETQLITKREQINVYFYLLS